MARAADAGGGDGLGLGEAEHARGDKGRDELGEGGMMPADLAHARGCGQTPAHLQLVGDEDAGDEVADVPSGFFSGRQGRGDDVRGMAGILLPVDIVIVDGADEQAVHQRCIGGVGAQAAADDGGVRDAAELYDIAVGGAHVLVVHRRQGAAKAVEQKSPRLLAGGFGDRVVLEIEGEAGHILGDAHIGSLL
ncbi:MAG: hypothetical protein BWY77_01934 [bacterium ADurb.Bin431]|nr:MAG: hypothetical protein BWY77_01934 [bacterium ADurb.Bin431]